MDVEQEPGDNEPEATQNSPIITDSLCFDDSDSETSSSDDDSDNQANRGNGDQIIKKKRKLDSSGVTLPPGFLEPLRHSHPQRFVKQVVEEEESESEEVNERKEESSGFMHFKARSLSDLESLSIPELVYYLKLESRTACYDKVCGILVEREERLKKCIQDLEDEVRVYKQKESLEINDENEVLNRESTKDENKSKEIQMDTKGGGDGGYLTRFKGNQVSLRCKEQAHYSIAIGGGANFEDDERTTINRGREGLDKKVDMRTENKSILDKKLMCDSCNLEEEKDYNDGARMRKNTIETEGGITGACSSTIKINRERLRCDERGQDFTSNDSLCQPPVKSWGGGHDEDKERTKSNTNTKILDKKVNVRTNNKTLLEKATKKLLEESCNHGEKKGHIDGVRVVKDSSLRNHSPLGGAKRKNTIETERGIISACSSTVKINQERLRCDGRGQDFTSNDSLCQPPMKSWGGGHIEDEERTKANANTKILDKKVNVRTDNKTLLEKATKNLLEESCNRGEKKGHTDGVRVRKNTIETEGGVIGACSSTIKINQERLRCDEGGQDFTSNDSLCQPPVKSRGGGHIEDEERTKANANTKILDKEVNVRTDNKTLLEKAAKKLLEESCNHGEKKGHTDGVRVVKDSSLRNHSPLGGAKIKNTIETGGIIGACSSTTKINQERLRCDERGQDLTSNDSLCQPPVKSWGGGHIEESCNHGEKKGHNDGVRVVKDSSLRNHSPLGGAKGVESNMCHQCQRIDKGEVVRCKNCRAKRYCFRCLRWYPQISYEDVAACCPFCRGICICKQCLRKVGKLKNIYSEMQLTKDEKINYSKYMVHLLLPLVTEIDNEQMMEKEVEAKIQGKTSSEIALQQADCYSDERIYCDNCRTSIFDLHRNCAGCSYDLCLACCAEIRRDCVPGGGEMVMELYPYRARWKVESGRIYCPPKKLGGCGSRLLELKRIFPENWVSKMKRELRK